MVKTADDRLAVVWPEIVRDGDCTPEQLEQVIVRSLKRHGRKFDDVFQNLVQKTEPDTGDLLFSY